MLAVNWLAVQSRTAAHQNQQKQQRPPLQQIRLTTTTVTNATTTESEVSTTSATEVTTTESKPATTTSLTEATTTESATTTTTKAADTDIYYGDVNQDGAVDLLDAIFINKALANMVTLSESAAKCADCYDDGVLDERDATILMQFVIGKINDVPSKEL